MHSRVEVFSKVAPASNPRRVAFGVAEALHEAMAWGDVCDSDCEDSAALEFSPFCSLSPNRVQEAPLHHWCRVTSSLVGRSYSAAGQATAMLHSMTVLQAYQVELLKELDEGEGITPEAVKELWRATDLALPATKHTARAVGRSMAGMVAVERHLWLNLTDIKEKDKSFLMDALISKDGLFGNSVTAVDYVFTG
ncbi:hypothetical protein G5714_022516 [Onychostoma macrolepis]|uniref:Uncharacterized protein n=1 Tax=Onychostoma macrolepis TaxID=369639 RepID=A0A7J6BNE2_9TELE|nr:hypothetical protein G5714_022516 [Onychostoma macrolepis]